MASCLQTRRLSRLHRGQTTPSTRSVPHTNLAVSIVSPEILWRPMSQLSLTTAELLHQVYLRFLQKESVMLSCLRTRSQDTTRLKSQSQSPMWVGRMSHLRKKVHLTTHQCYIQCLPKDVDEPKKKRVSRDEVGTRPFTEPEPNDPDTRVFVE